MTEEGLGRLKGEPRVGEEEGIQAEQESSLVYNNL